MASASIFAHRTKTFRGYPRKSLSNPVANQCQAAPMARRAAILSFVSRRRAERVGSRGCPAASMRAWIFAIGLGLRGSGRKGSIPNAGMDPGSSA